jgi:hypothetical protein
MSHVVALRDLDEVDRHAIERCRECIVRADDVAHLCGWHESLVAAVRAVRRLSGDES